MRLAVGLGGDRLVVAGAGLAGSRLLVRRPPLSPVTEVLRAALSAVNEPVDELVLTYPAHWPSSAIRQVVDSCAVAGARTRVCSSAVAAAREVAAREALPPGLVAVVEADSARVCVTVLDGGVTVRACRHATIAGPARSWELLVAAAADAGATAPELTGGVLLVGSMAGNQELVERLAELVGEPPRVPDDPETVAVLGALRPVPPPARRRTPSTPQRQAAPAAAEAPPAERGAVLGAGLLPAPARRHPARPLLAASAGAVLAALCTLLVVAQFGVEAREPVEAGAEERTLLAQYDYTLRVPGGWRHSGGLPERRRTLLTPAAAPAGSDLISVEQTPLGYDSAAERDRAFRELRERYRQAVDTGSRLDELTMATRVAGRDVIAYRQSQPGMGTEVQWYVLFDRDTQFSVGCQHTPSGIDTVRAACAVVLGSLRPR